MRLLHGAEGLLPERGAPEGAGARVHGKDRSRRDVIPGGPLRLRGDEGAQAAVRRAGLQHPDGRHPKAQSLE